MKLAMDPAAATISQLQAESMRLQSLLGHMEVQLQDTRRALALVRTELEKRMRPSPVPRVSDHALLRFIERVLGFDVEAVRDRILTDTVKSAILAVASAVNVDGARLTVKDNTIVTVTVGEKKPKKVAKNSRPELSEDDAISEGLNS